MVLSFIFLALALAAPFWDVLLFGLNIRYWGGESQN
jgi:hypothetical protein